LTVGIIGTLIAVAALLALALARTVDERDEYQRRAEVYHIDAQEARQVAIISRAALATARREVDAAKKEHEAAQAKIAHIRKTITAAASDKKAIADLWNDED
jgi:hypothetical protein